jgi:hypothetical protein
MTRHWNFPIWAGFAIAVVALVSYVPFFALFPATRDVPWVNFLLFLAGAALLGWGLRRAFRDPENYRGKISGTILGGLMLLMAGFFCFSILYLGKQIPSSVTALTVGQQAPAFNLLNADGKQVALADLLKNHRAALLIFYRGYW